ncbi:MAG: acyl-CoA dehydrogenase, partial [Myxococcota bacterium]
IWEGTTNVLSLDTLRALLREGGLDSLARELEQRTRVRDHLLAEAGQVAREAVAHARAWLAQATRDGQVELEAGARRFAMTLGRAYALGLLVGHAQWSLDHEQDPRARAAALRFAQGGVDLVAPADSDHAWMLANDAPAPRDPAKGAAGD